MTFTVCSGAARLHSFPVPRRSACFREDLHRRRRRDSSGDILPGDILTDPMFTPCGVPPGFPCPVAAGLHRPPASSPPLPARIHVGVDNIRRRPAGASH